MKTIFLAIARRWVSFSTGCVQKFNIMSCQSGYMEAGSIFYHVNATLYSEAKFFIYEKHIISDRGDPDHWMDTWIFRVQRIRVNSYIDRTGSYRPVTRVDPQSVILHSRHYKNPRQQLLLPGVCYNHQPAKLIWPDQ
jgi:hypothetical protein